MTDYTKKFALYINEFNHTHRFSKEFLDEILKQIHIIQTNISDKHHVIAEIAKMLSSVVSNLQPSVYINIPLLDFISPRNKVKADVTYSLHANRIEQFIVRDCGYEGQVFLDNEVARTQLSSAQIDGLASIIYELLTNNNDEAVENICNVLLQTDIGKHCIIDMYNLLKSTYVDQYAEEDMEMLQVVELFAQRALVTDNITADDIKDLFDI